MNDEEKMRKKEEAGLERKVASRNIKECFLKTSREAERIAKF